MFSSTLRPVSRLVQSMLKGRRSTPAERTTSATPAGRAASEADEESASTRTCTSHAPSLEWSASESSSSEIFLYAPSILSDADDSDSVWSHEAVFGEYVVEEPSKLKLEMPRMEMGSFTDMVMQGLEQAEWMSAVVS